MFFRFFYEPVRLQRTTYSVLIFFVRFLFIRHSKRRTGLALGGFSDDSLEIMRNVRRLRLKVRCTDNIPSLRILPETLNSANDVLLALGRSMERSKWHWNLMSTANQFAKKIHVTFHLIKSIFWGMPAKTLCLKILSHQKISVYFQVLRLKGHHMRCEMFLWLSS